MKRILLLLLMICSWGYCIAQQDEIGKSETYIRGQNIIGKKGVTKLDVRYKEGKSEKVLLVYKDAGEDFYFLSNDKCYKIIGTYRDKRVLRNYTTLQENYDILYDKNTRGEWETKNEDGIPIRFYSEYSKEFKAPAFIFLRK